MGGIRAFCIFVVMSSAALFAADKEHLDMLARAQAAFDRVVSIPSPPLPDASTCVQAQAAMLSVALPAEESELHYRKGFCGLAMAALTHSQSAYADAAAELDRGGAAMLAWLARRAGNLPEQEKWDQAGFCPKSCEPLVPVAKLWRGWIFWNEGDVDAAAVQFDARPNSGWPNYADGMRTFRGGRYKEAVARYQEALQIWTQRQEDKDPPLTSRLGPPEDIPQLRTDLAGALILAGDPKGAIAMLDRAVEAAPTPRAYFLRGRAKELSGQLEPALADYNLASRAAFADAKELASGEAHLYRGIVYYRRKDYPRAEAEFASALNFQIGAALRPDATAWRHLSAVASGSCGASRDYLERSLASVSPYFPKAEAQAVAARCPAAPAF
ncbi:MAG TPA: tetratricopeptide repeat protein [Bryobacteraceae bacterium]|nr:tetratricopeptide repeat protein [Bryobacteraceae bacterium]